MMPLLLLSYTRPLFLIRAVLANSVEHSALRVDGEAVIAQQMVANTREMIAFDMVERATLDAQAMEAVLVFAAVILTDVLEAGWTTLVDDVLADEAFFDERFKLTINRRGSNLDANLCHAVTQYPCTHVLAFVSFEEGDEFGALLRPISSVLRCHCLCPVFLLRWVKTWGECPNAPHFSQI